MDLLTVVMHELGHLLGHEHSDDPDDLMASVLSLSPRGTSSPVLSPSPFLPHPSSLISYPSSFIARPSSRADDVFAEWGDDSSNSDSQSPLVAAKDGDLLAAATVRPSEEATQARVPRRSRLQRYERDLDAWFAELAVEEAGQ